MANDIEQREDGVGDIIFVGVQAGAVLMGLKL